jgi:hypothetical protein
MSKVKFKDLITSINEAPTGGFVGLTDYISNDLSVVSVTGRIGCSYGKVKELAIEALKDAIDNEDFEAIDISGRSWSKTENGVTEFFARKAGDRVLADNLKSYSKDTVLDTAKAILEGWENPKARKSNKVEMSDKENGLGYNSETGTFTFTLMVDHEYYKESKSEAIQEGVEMVELPQNPDTMLKAGIRDRFMKKIKTYAIAEGKFANLTIGGNKFQSDNITF